jgi:thiol-disulfide isomerase/thioredoxin
MTDGRTTRRRVIGSTAAGLALAAVGAGPALAKRPLVGEPAPNFQVTTLDGRKFNLTDFKGLVVVLNFWATWCGPCRVELPLLDHSFRRLKDRGLQVFAVTTEDSVPLWRLKPVAAALAIPIVRNLRGPYETLDGVPTNYVIDRAGVLRYARSGAFQADDIDTLLVPLLDEAPPAPAPAQTATP